MALPALAAAGAQGLFSLSQGIYGLIEKNRAKKEQARLAKSRPDVGVPSAFIERADEPISEKLRSSRDQLAARRTAGAVSALGKGGARTLLGGLPSVLGSERDLETQRYGQYDQARIDALGALGGAQERAIGRKTDMWNQQVAGTQVARAEGIRNMFGGLGGMLRSGVSAVDALPEGGDTGKTIGDTRRATTPLTGIIPRTATTATGLSAPDIQGMGDVEFIEMLRRNPQLLASLRR